jgi:hypothetical protein
MANVLGRVPVLVGGGKPLRATGGCMGGALDSFVTAAI